MVITFKRMRDERPDLTGISLRENTVILLGTDLDASDICTIVEDDEGVLYLSGDVYDGYVEEFHGDMMWAELVKPKEEAGQPVASKYKVVNGEVVKA